MELPASWNLWTKRRGAGCDVMGKDDSGSEYRVRTCDSPVPTERDVAEIAAVDRERYPSRATGARAFTMGLVESGKRRRMAQEQCFQDDLEEAALPVVRAGLERTGSTVGYSRAYAANYSKVFSEV